MRYFLLLAFICVLASCSASSTSSNPESLQRARSIAASPEALTSFLRDTTAKSYTSEHGTQFSYFGADGSYNLVYPGNTSVLKGRWEVRGSGGAARICYSYTVRSFNPATRNRSEPGDWSCNPAIGSLIRWREIRDGDPLNLANTTLLPRILPKGLNLSLPGAAKAVGLSTSMSDNKSPNPDKAADARVGQ